MEKSSEPKMEMHDLADDADYAASQQQVNKSPGFSLRKVHAVVFLIFMFVLLNWRNGSLTSERFRVGIVLGFYFRSLVEF